MANKIKIIMNQDVLNLGEEGDTCDVAPGYARNYLFPKKLAVPYNSHYLTILNQKKRKIEKRREEKKVQAQDMKARIQNEDIIFTLQAGENGKLFGSITNGHIAEELQKRGFSIERKKIEVPDHHLKMVGTYSVKVNLYGDEEANLKVTINALEIPAKGKPDKDEKKERGRRKVKSEIDTVSTGQSEATTTEENEKASAPVTTETAAIDADEAAASNPEEKAGEATAESESTD